LLVLLTKPEQIYQAKRQSATYAGIGKIDGPETPQSAIQPFQRKMIGKTLQIALTDAL